MMLLIQSNLSYFSIYNTINQINNNYNNNYNINRSRS